MKEFTDDEKIIARNIDKIFKWIARDEFGSLYAYSRRPIKRESNKRWEIPSGGAAPFFLFNRGLFEAIKWEDDEPTRISDIYDPQVLDEAEREYLKTVLEPFREEVDYVKKIKHHMIDNETYNKEYLYIKLYDGEFTFPDFDPGKMYAGMERDREYKLDELEITY